MLWKTTRAVLSVTHGVVIGTHISRARKANGEILKWDVDRDSKEEARVARVVVG